MTEQSSSPKRASSAAAAAAPRMPSDEQNLEEIQQKTVSTWFGNKIVLFGPDGETLSCEEEEKARKELLAKQESSSNSNSNSTEEILADAPNVYTGWIRKNTLLTDPPSMEEIKQWHFDVLLYSKETLVPVVEAMFVFYDLYTKFNIDVYAMKSFIVTTMKRHHNHVYHNWYHAVSATHSSFLFLTLGGADEYLEDRDIFAILLGALVHDVEHTGNNNDFEYKAETELAKMYPHSVLELHSIAQALDGMLEEPNLDMLKHVGCEDREYIRRFAKEVIIATDVANHGKITESLANLVVDAAADAASGNDNGNSTTTHTFFNKEDFGSRLLLGRSIVHAADISSSCHEPFHVAQDWTCRISSEFSRQATKEKENGLPVTTYMTGLDTEEKVARMQVNFMNFMVIPFFKVIAQVIPKAKHLAENAIVNTNNFKEIADHLEAVRVAGETATTGTTTASVGDVDTEEGKEVQ